jgi:error-prone DNA polymerase
MAEYVELHCHSCCSFREGASTPLELILQARKLGYPALALTDHDGLAGAMEFARTAKECDVKPIIGAELTLKDNAHLTLIAETPRGYANLSRLLSIAHLSSPREDVALASEQLAGRTEGLIALSGCRHGEVSQLVSAYDARGAKRAAARYLELFGRENYFIELQDNLVYGDRRRNCALVELARSLGLNFVATNNIHYHKRERHRLQDVLVAVRHRTTLDASERLRRKNAEFYLKSPTEMAALFADLRKRYAILLPSLTACRSTSRMISPTCSRTMSPLTVGRRTLCWKTSASPRRNVGICRSLRRSKSGLRHELDLIRQSGQAGFFLRNWELMQYAHDNELPARGRGSSVGSLVCYLLGLSGIDPIKYNLFVGRFLNEARQKEDVPDIDIDFAREVREKMFQHVFATYGTEYAAMVANVIQYRYPMAIRDVGKALGLPEADVDKLAKRIRGRFAGTLVEEMRALPEFRARMTAPIWQTFLELVEELVGKPRHLSQHSGGVIISSTPIVEQVPVQRSEMDGRYICQWDKDSVADAGFIKMDFLGYPSLGHLYRSLKLIEERHGRRFDPVLIPLDDPQVYEMIQAGDILGIVQIQSRAQLQAILRLKISCIEDLVVQVALIRPGPIQGGAVNPYIARCQGIEPVTYDHACLEPILAETKGVIVFQEQVLEVSMAVAGFTAGQAETLRRAMSRKRSREEMEKLHEAFLEGCRVKRLIDPLMAQRIYEKVLAFAEYGFPKAHAAAMAETAGKLAWVKRYYPLEFYCSWLNEWPFGFYSPGVIVNEARRRGIEVRGVDASKSRAECAIENDTVRLGFNYVKGIGAATLQRLDAERGHGAYASLWQFWSRARIARESIEHLVRLGAFAWTGLHEPELLWQLGLFYRPLNAQLPLALSYDADMVALREMGTRERVRDDIRLTEGAITTRGHIMDLTFVHEGITPSVVVDRMQQGERLTVAGVVAVRQAPETAKGFVFHTLEDRYGLINVITTPALVRKYKALATEASALIVHGHIERQERAVNVVTDRMELLAVGECIPGSRTHSFGSGHRH